jgi:hypothetical protein
VGDQIPWHRLFHAYGAATDAPVFLDALAQDEIVEVDREPRILPDQAQDQDTDGAHGRWPSAPFGFRDVRVPLSHEVAVPAQDRVRPDEQAQPDRGRGCSSAARNARSAGVKVTVCQSSSSASSTAAGSTPSWSASATCASMCS